MSHQRGQHLRESKCSGLVLRRSLSGMQKHKNQRLIIFLSLSFFLSLNKQADNFPHRTAVC